MNYLERIFSNRQAKLPAYTPDRVQQAKREKKPFLIVQVLFDFFGGRRRITIPSETTMATTREERKEMESDPNPELWRWGAAGTLVIVHCKDRSVAVVIKRDSGAPTYPDCWTLGSGLSSPGDNLSNPTHTAVREGVEEIRIATRIPKNDPRPQGVVRPVFEDPELNAITDDSDEDLENATHPAVPDEFKTKNRVLAKASFYRAPGEEELEIVREDGSEPSTVQTGTLAIDPNTRGIDFLKVVEVDMRDYTVDELVFFDGEVLDHGRQVDGLVGCIPVTEETDKKGERRLRLGTELTKVQKSGKDVDPTEYPLTKQTPPLARMVDSMNADKDQK